jgi:predicted hydrocarbon binding protein
MNKKDNNWLKRLISTNSFEYKDGELIVLKTPVWLYPLNTSVILQKTLEDKYGKDIADLYYGLGKMQAEMGMNQMLKIFGYKKDLKFLKDSMDQPKTIGYGNLNLERYDEKSKTIFFKNTNTPFARKYMELFGVQKEPVDHFIRGACAAAGEVMFGEECLAIEQTCIAQGKEFCIFEVKPLKNWNPKDLMIKKQSVKKVGLIEKNRGLKKFLKK